ncbi:hypothetical protein [Microvirga lotononidis]|uniref:Uncharacterized protein n=1 Tax=Microvirga lotononidis TaxID=864069 RepID=I4Z300_9HYPH|nr:hypothetical protein [Microvirga lotononidis]EIM30592.1 hypothetical protein MicloDRAFT_00008420 [Microvirga lotononidis]WQO26420.1 hypothetical protein U0023_17235 [Microvirga lotononidis]
MNGKRSLVFFEMAAGLLGWVWIGMTIWFLWAIIAVFAFNGTWSHVLYALFGGMVAKWLARGFGDNAKRVRFEQQMILNGATPQEAAQAWIKAYQ